MSTVQRALFVLIALAAAGGVGFLLLSGENDPLPAGLDLGGPGERTAPLGNGSRAATPNLNTPDLRSSARPDEVDPERTSLSVIVVDDDGRPIPTAAIAAVGPEGARIEGQGSLEWLEATPGPWALTVTDEGLLPFRRKVVVEAGARTRITAQLRDHVRLEGRVLDLMGRPVEGQTLWLLAEGRAHPAKGEKPKDLPFASTDRTGEFSLRANEEGIYRVSVGKIGEEILTSAPLDLHLGGPERLEVVLASGGTLLVQLEDPPPGLTESRATVRVAVLKRRKATALAAGSAGSAGSAGTEGRGRRDGARRDRTGAGDAATEPPAGEPAPPGAGIEEWKEVANLELDGTGRVQFDDLPVGPDLRLVLLRRNDRFESELPIVLLEGRPLAVRLSLPAKRTKDEIAARPIGTLYYAVQADRDAVRPGIRLIE